jgi:integrase
MKLLRSIDSRGLIGSSLSPSAIRAIVRRYGATIGLPDLAPHDLRRTHARLAREGGAPLETIQHSLGHASVQTTERYTRTGEEANAGDYIQL